MRIRPTNRLGGDDTIPAVFELKLLGAFDAHVQGEPVAPLRSKKSRWVLALLALRSGCEVERSWVAGVLWPESTEE